MMDLASQYGLGVCPDGCASRSPCPISCTATALGSGQAVLLIHGTASTRAVWDETLASLGPDLRAIRYDRRGYGQSGAPEPEAEGDEGRHDGAYRPRHQ